MKKIIISMLLFTVTVVFAQEVKVPKVVKAGFDRRFPGAENPVWEKAKENYQVQFIYDTKHQAYFAADGKWLKTVAFIEEENLPKATSEYIMNSYEEFELLQIQEIVTNKRKTSYMVILLVGADKITLYFDVLGEYIEK